MAPRTVLFKWTTRALFAACAAAGIGAWTCFEEMAQEQEWESRTRRSGNDDDIEAFGTYLPPLPSNRISRRVPTQDGRPSLGCPNLLVRHNDMYLLFRDDTLIARFASLADYGTYATEQIALRQKQRAEKAAAAAAATGTTGDGASAAASSAPVNDVCPLLFVEPEVDTQGRRRYRRRDAHQDRRDRGTVRGLGAAFWDWQHLGSVPTDRPLVAALGGNDLVAPSSSSSSPSPNQHDAADTTTRKRPRPFNVNDSDKWLRSDLVRSAAEARAAMSEISDNAMDPHWGGVRWTQQVIDSGKYDNHTIVRDAVV